MGPLGRAAKQLAEDLGNHQGLRPREIAPPTSPRQARGTDGKILDPGRPPPPLTPRQSRSANHAPPRTRDLRRELRRGAR
jgi:hypothetical protein